MNDVSAWGQSDAVYKTLLESTKAIPWKIDWATKKFAYIGPQIEPLLGWPQDSWQTEEDWVMRMHPDDRDNVVSFCVSQSQAGIDHEADYRALTAENGYVWIRDVVHVMRFPDGSPEALVGFMFDITERKKTEEKLLVLQRELEALSFEDGLTGIANRRRFDACFAMEWDRALSDGAPLSVLLFDIDCFKQYNDEYGHIQGDKCLVDIASTLSLAVDGPHDLVARYGGEEFVILLPRTDAATALKVANRCQRLIQKRSIPHAQSPIREHVTVSIGAGTITPDADVEPSAFLDDVDKQLYAAKKSGKNRIVAMHSAPSLAPSPLDAK